jgi:hypothetical protein
MVPEAPIWPPRWLVGTCGIRCRRQLCLSAVEKFSYYDRLSAKNKAIYRKGDAISRVVLPDDDQLRGHLAATAASIAQALAADAPSRARARAQQLCDLVTHALDTEPVTVRVLRVRPQRSYGELHGLYTRDDGKPPTIRVWMRTAQRADVVKPRTFLRTLMHEVCHHLDYAHYRLGESFHNPGFFKRESSLMRLLNGPPATLAPATPQEKATVEPEPAAAAVSPPAPPEPVQLRLPEF